MIANSPQPRDAGRKESENRRVSWVPIDRLEKDPALQLRALPNGATTDPAWVHELKEFREDGGVWDELPLVVSDGEHFWLVRGFHRVEAEAQRGLGSIEAEVVPGDFRDALYLAVAENSRHGLPRSNACKRRAVNALIDAPDLLRRASETHKQYRNDPTRLIAAACCVSRGLVGKVLEERGLHASNGKLVKKEQKPKQSNPASSLSVGDSVSAEQDSEAHCDRDDGPAFTPPPIPSKLETLLRNARGFVESLEDYVSSGELWVLDERDRANKPFVVDMRGDARGREIDESYRTADQRKTELALGLAETVDKGRVQAVACCPFMWDLIGVLNRGKPKSLRDAAA